jgi:hypothetical protein
MTKQELKLIANALRSSRVNFTQEADLFELKGERPVLVEYLRSELIPKIEAAYKIVINNYKI